MFFSKLTKTGRELQTSVVRRHLSGHFTKAQILSLSETTSLYITSGKIYFTVLSLSVLGFFVCNVHPRQLEFAGLNPFYLVRLTNKLLNV